MVSLYRAFAATVLLTALTGCVSSPEQVFTPPAIAAPPAPIVQSELQIDANEFEAGFAKAREKQDAMFQILTLMLQEATRPELLAAVKQSAERLKVATQDLNTVQ